MEWTKASANIFDVKISMVIRRLLYHGHFIAFNEVGIAY